MGLYWPTNCHLSKRIFWALWSCFQSSTKSFQSSTKSFQCSTKKFSKNQVLQFPSCFRAPVWEIIRWNAADKRGWNLRSSSNSKTASPSLSDQNSPILSSDQNSPILFSDQNSPSLSDQNPQAPKLYVWNSWWGTFWSPKLICSLASLALQSANPTTGQFANSTTGCTIYFLESMCLTEAGTQTLGQSSLRIMRKPERVTSCLYRD